MFYRKSLTGWKQPKARREDNRVDGELANLTLSTEYRSDSSNTIEDFYVPCLGRSVLYRRAVGYFTSQGLAVAAQGLAALIKAGGVMRLVASPHLQPDDLEAIRRGYVAREDAVTKALIAGIENVQDEIIRDRLNVLAWLVAEGRLEVRIAVPLDERSAIRDGIYHEKLGLFSDGKGNVVAFTGSPNETSGGLIDNFEAIDVFCSWDDPQGRVTRKVDNFERLWMNTTKGLLVLDFPAAAREQLLSYQTSSVNKAMPVPRVTSRWRHQDEAISKFLDHERGVLEMATGTGKTRTALRICETLANRGDIHTILVSADGVNLLEQWHIQLLSLRAELAVPFVVYRHYGDYHDRERFNLNPRRAILLISRPALAPAMRTLRASFASRTLLIHDEVHRLGSPGNRESLNGLSDNVRFRLGLSATPEREYDAEGTTFIERHVGPVIFSFGLADAIRRGILSPFDYHPLIYVPDENDRRRLQEVYRRAEARERAGEPMSREEIWIELAKVHKTSLAKLPVFERFLGTRVDVLERCIIFVETQEYGDLVLRIVHRYRHDFHTYYSGEESETLQRFANGEIECLLTCHRLSEGIDIRSIQSVILFSSARSRLETIQRIGRCLRIDPQSPSKRANVVDFIRASDTGESGNESDDSRREWLQELSRIVPDEESR
jgi:superfamily II DNA or RNA helicase